ncbi:MAG TPA: ATP-binding cassette domain-containing protein [Solirubrobacteraceae bacterium]
MSLLELEHVERRHRSGAHERTILRDVTLELDAGELVAIWGLRRCGRSTLLRIAAAIEPVDSGLVRFAARELGAVGSLALGGGIGYCTRASLDAPSVLDELLLGQLARGVRRLLARARAYTALARVGAADCAERAPHELDGAEEMRVALARALALEPSLLVIDDPVRGVDLLQRDSILSLLRSLADEGIAVLISADEATALAGADRALALSDGVLRGASAPELAEVLPLRRDQPGRRRASA